VSGNDFVPAGQCTGTPRRERATDELLRKETPASNLWPPNSPDLISISIVHICYIQCDLFDCYIFNDEIMPATLANTFLFILQGSAVAQLKNGGRFYGTLCRS